jgi:para-nitrobenzyl esterase
MDAWCRFARTGSPEGGSLPSWPRYDAARRATMVLDSCCRVVNAPAEPERVAWERVHRSAGGPLTRLWVD